MRAIVTGSMNWHDRELINGMLDSLDPVITLLIAGDDKGVDSFALDWAESRGIEFKEFYADYQGHGPAGFRLRNQRMFEHGDPDLVIAFLPGSRSTEDITRRADRIGVEVYGIEVFDG